MLHSCSIFWSYHPCYKWMKHITSTSSCSMCLRLEKNKESFGFVGVFPPTEPMHLISTLSLWAGHTSSKVWESQLILQISTSVLNLSNQSPNSKPRRVWQKVTSPLKASSKESFTRRSPVRRTYNTEPSPKELAWGRSTPVYLSKYFFPFVLVLISFN